MEKMVFKIVGELETKKNQVKENKRCCSFFVSDVKCK